MSKFNSIYRILQSGLRQEIEADKKLSNRLNKWDKIKDRMYSEFVEPIVESDLGAEKRVSAIIIAQIVMMLCTFDKINLWRSKDGKKTLLAERDIERLDDGKGISMHRLFIIAYALGKKAVKDIEDLTRANIGGVTNDQWLEYAEEYHAEKAKSRAKRKAKKEAKVEEVEVDETPNLSELSVDEVLEALEKDGSRVKELTDAEKAQEVRKYADEAKASRGVKGILTKQINSLS